MRKLLNTLFVTSEDSYLALENDNVVVLRDARSVSFVHIGGHHMLQLQGGVPGADGSLRKPRHTALLYDAPGTLSGTGLR